jgi:hypothetical protein
VQPNPYLPFTTFTRFQSLILLKITNRLGVLAGELLSRPVAGVLVTESAVLGVYVKRLKREEKRGAGSSS